jgi:hypothetical protein
LIRALTRPYRPMIVAEAAFSDFAANTSARSRIAPTR